MTQAEGNEKKHRERGTGRVWRIGKIYYIQFYSHGRQIRESSHSEKLAVAERKLRRRIGEVAAGQYVGPQADRIRYEELRDALYADYQTNKRKSLLIHTDGTHYLCGVLALDDFFKGYRAAGITTDRIRAFIAKRQEQGVPNPTINRSLAALRRMFRLAAQDGKLRDIPHVPMLKESPPRRGFLEPQDFSKLRAALPEYMRSVLTMGYLTGMRLGEILNLKWENVALNQDGLPERAQLWDTKNGEPRTVPLIGELPQMLMVLLQKHPGSEFVFTREGKQIGSFRKAWCRACVRAGLGETFCRTCGDPTGGTRCAQCKKAKRASRLVYHGLIFHDLRRSGVRNLVRAGVPERVAMAISGHKTRAVFERYNIVSERDLKDAARKLENYIAERKEAYPEISPTGEKDGQRSPTSAKVN